MRFQRHTFVFRVIDAGKKRKTVSSTHYYHQNSYQMALDKATKLIIQRSGDVNPKFVGLTKPVRHSR